MRWNAGAPLVGPVLFNRVRLRRAALRYADHDWEVLPGACLSGDRFVCGRAGCPTMACHPALERWEVAATSDLARVATWWRTQPHAVLLATGDPFDVLEVPAHLGLRVLGAARLLAGVLGSGRGQVRGPIAVTPTGRWMILVRPGDPLRPELEERLDVVRHGPGSWIPAPPTRLPEGAVRWALAPEATQWQLPDSYAVQGMLVDALSMLQQRSPAPLLPRQPTTARRGN